MIDGKNILIVDDSVTVRKEVSMILTRLGAKVLEAGNEYGMMQNIEAYGRVVDLIIMDLGLRNENGLELIRKLRETEKYQSIRVMVLTENAQANNVLAARDLQVRAFYRKPITMDEFVKKVDMVLEAPVAVTAETAGSAAPEAAEDPAVPEQEILAEKESTTAEEMPAESSGETSLTEESTDAGAADASAGSDVAEGS